MNVQEFIQPAIKGQATRLHEVIGELQKFDKEVHLSGFPFNSYSIDEKFKFPLNVTNHVYVIKTKHNNPEKLVRLFSNFKTKNKKTHKLSLVNAAPETFNGILYVGSSGSLNTRMNQHLGLTGKTVYSLQLREWGRNEISTVDIQVIPIPEKYNEILQYIENALWDFYQPLFGKKGANVNSSHRQ